MIPKKPNSLFREVAEKLEVEEGLVDKFITHYYKDVRKHLSELNHTRINLDGLGQMIIKPTSVDRLIEKYTRIVNKTNTYEFSGYFNKKRLEERLESLGEVKKKIDEFNEAKAEFKNRVNEPKEDLDK